MPGCRWLVAVFLYFLTAWAYAANSWYVAPAASGGNDANPGTLAQPFYTIAKAGSVAGAGDIIYARGGTYSYTTQQWIGCTGNNSNWITFQPYPAESPILDFGSMPTTIDAVVIGGQYIAFQGFEIKNSPRNGLAGWGAAHLKLMNNNIHACQFGGIFVGYSSLGTVQDVLVANNLVTNTVIMNQPETLTAWPAAIMVDKCAGTTITGNSSYQNYGEGIVLDLSDSGVILNNQIHDNYSVGIYLDNTTHTLVAKNLVYTTYDTRFYLLSYPSSGIVSANETYAAPNPINYNQILNNVVIGGRFCFYYGNYLTGGGLKNYVVANNTFYNGDFYTFWIDDDAGHANNLIENNIIYQGAGNGLVRFSAQTAAFNFNHNAWYATAPSFVPFPGDILSPPLFVNPGTNIATDYELQPGSPVINAGVTLNQVTDDYLGTSRPQGAANDIGAFEYIPPTPTFTVTATFTSTPTPTMTFTSTFTPTATNTATITYTPTATSTPTVSMTPSSTFTPTLTSTPSLTGTPTPTSTPTLTSTPTPTSAATSTSTVTFTPSSSDYLPYPNPWDGVGPLSFYYTVSPGIPEAKLKIVTVADRKVFEDTGLDASPGRHLYQLNWNKAGLNLANGLYYFVVVPGGAEGETRRVMKVILLK